MEGQIARETGMSGLLALLDDVAAIAKVAASSIDDIVSAAAKSGAKAAGVVIDDTAVTPKYAHGFAADRELPIIWRISLGSLRNKLFVLLPAALALSAFYPQGITPLLMLGGLYLCFEGAEKLFHVLFPHADHEVEEDFDVQDPAHLEETRVAGAIKTDFVLSAEIMTIALAAIPANGFWFEAAALAIVGIGITVAVYGSVALIVKMDDIGLFMARRGRLSPTRALGRLMVRGMPRLLDFLSTLGTAAMLWVGGSILTHGAEELGWPWLAHHIEGVAALMPAGILHWAAAAALNGVIGTALGFVLIPLVTRAINPVLTRLISLLPSRR
jgi:uncharacterized protein